MGYFSFPHTRTYDSDLGWLIKHLKGIDEKLDEYLENSVITFADPIQWDITEQYTALTMVIDSDGTAYLSKQPVPAGVDISNTDYWMPIFNYDDNINQLRANITTNTENTGILPDNAYTGDIVWYQGDLYELTSDLPAGAVIIPGTNAHPITVETWVQNMLTGLNNLIADETTARENADITINGRIDGETTARENADITINGRIDNEITARENADITINDRIDGIASQIAAFDDYIIKPEKYGAKGDGITNDTAAIQEALNEASLHHGTVWFQHGKTYITTELTVYSNTRLYSDGGVLKLKDNTFIDSSTLYYILKALDVSNVIFDSLVIDGNNTMNTDFRLGDGITAAGGDNIIIKDCWLYNIPDSGIMFSNLNNSICINNRIDVCSDAGIYYNTGAGNSGFQNIVAFNRISNAGTSGIALKRVSQKALIIGNMIRSCPNGITLEHASTPNDYSTIIMIANNRMLDIATTGIDLRVSSYCNVVGNMIEDFGSYGILIQGSCGFNTITGNIIHSDNTKEAYANYGGGIVLIDRDNYLPNRNTFTGNSIRCRDVTNTRPAIRLISRITPNAQGERNVFVGNIINGQTVGMAISQYFNKGLITGNSIEGTYTNNSANWVYDNNITP